MITLPDPRPSRGPLRGFWITMCLTAGWLPVTAGARTSGARGAALATAGVTALCLGGVAKPDLVRRPYHAWAGLASTTSRHLTVYTAWVTHVTAIDGRAGQPEAPNGTSSDGWSATRAQSMEAYPSASTSLRDIPAARGVQDTYRWATGQGVSRAGWLAACLAVLRWVQPEAETDHVEALPHDTYTLY